MQLVSQIFILWCQMLNSFLVSCWLNVSVFFCFPIQNLQVDEVFLQGLGADLDGRFKCEDVVRLLRHGEPSGSSTDTRSLTQN